MLYEPIKDKKILEMAKEMIDDFHNSLEQCFGPQAYTYTAHAHLHLVDQVLDHGPLYDSEQFCFEVINFHFVRFILGIFLNSFR